MVELPGDDHLPFAGQTEQVLDEIQEFLTGTGPARSSIACWSPSSSPTSSDRRNRSPDWVTAGGASHWTATTAWWQRQLERFRGRHVNTTGDGTLATFDGPARAIECARAIAETVRSLDLEIRAGLHTGEIEARGENVAGMAVHIAARVSALAAGGEVLVSRTVTDLVTGSGIEFEDRGDHQLKGVPGAWRRYVLRSDRGG